MRKNIARVIEAFKAGQSVYEATCSTDGTTLYSYGMPIARWVRGAGESHVNLLDERQSPSKTTTSQIRSVALAFAHYNTVGEL